MSNGSDYLVKHIRQTKQKKKAMCRHITVINMQNISIMECTEGKMHRMNLKSVQMSAAWTR